MNIHSKIKSSIIFIIGYALSPLSWWNDLLINIPLAYMMVFWVSIFSDSLFLPAMIFAYWVTNLLGMVIMQYGAFDLFGKVKEKLTRKQLVRDLLLTCAYTALIAIMIQFEVIRFPTEYFENKSPTNAMIDLYRANVVFIK